MRKVVLAAYMVFAVFSIISILWIIPNFTPSFGGVGMPPATLPYTLCAIIFIFSCITIVRICRNGGDEPNPFTRYKCMHLAIFSAPLFLAMPLMRTIGFVPASFVILTVLQILCGQRNIPVLFFISLCASCAFWACLTYVLHVPMP